MKKIFLVVVIIWVWVVVGSLIVDLFDWGGFKEIFFFLPVFLFLGLILTAIISLDWGTKKKDEVKL